MRNLKRALSLALAAIMVIGMMVVGAGAVSIDDFSDKDEIVNKEAVTTMVSLGVINGKDDGSYDPSGIVTRAEMAKLIAVTLNGGKDPTLGAITANFTDTQGHWAESYIAYVASLGIIDGRGDGTFGPNDQVTGAQAAKMILTMLGYRSDIEGFTGANWAINVQTKGNDIDLFADMSINPDEGLTRDDTAQMLYNGVQSWMVEYRNLEGSYDGIVYPQPLNGTKANSTVLIEKFKVSKVEGVVVATELIAMSGETTTVNERTRLDDIEYNGSGVDADGNRWGAVTYPIAIDSAYLGQRVVIYVKGLNDLSPNASSMEVVGTYIVSDDNTVVTTTGRLKDADAVKDALKGSGIAVPNGGAAGVTITWDDTTKDVNGYDGITGVDSYPGMEQTFIDNDDDGTVEVIIQKNPGLTKVNTYNESKETLNLSGIGTVDFEDVVNPADVAQGDYVLVYNYDDTYVLAIPETVSGQVSAYVNNATNQHLSQITVDGTNYGWSAGENLAPDLWDVTDYNGIRLDDLVDGSYTLYLDPHGNMMGLVEDEAAVGSYAVITGVNPTGTTKGFYAVEVKVILSDGSTGKYDVNLVASAKNWSAATDLATNTQKEEAMYNALTAQTGGEYDVVDTLVSYSLDGDTITLNRPEYSTNNYYEANDSVDSLELKNSQSKYVFDNGTAATGDDETVMADNRTVFFIRDVEDNYSVVTGLNNLRADALTTYNGSVIYYMTPGNDTRTARAVFAHVDELYSSNSNYAYISGDYTRITEGSNYVWSYPVVLENGEVSTLKSKTQDNIGKNEVHEYQVSGDYVTFDNDTSDVYSKLVVTGVGSNAVSVADAKNPDTRKDSFPTNGATIWNVEDTDNIYETDLQINDLVSLVLDRDGNVQTAFVYDRQDGDMATAGAMTLQNNGAALAAGTTDLYNVVAGEKLSVHVTANAEQTVTVSATVKGVKQPLTNDGKLDNSANTAGSANFTFDIYTYTATENGTEVVISIAVAQDGYATRTLTYTLKLWGAAGTTILGDADSDAINAATENNIVVNGDLTVDKAITLATGKTVTVKGDMALKNTIAGGGSFVVEGTTTMENGSVVNAALTTKGLAFAKDATVTVKSGRTLTVTGDSISLVGNVTVDEAGGIINATNATLALNGYTLTNNATINVKETKAGSTLAGTGTLNTQTVVLAGDFVLAGGIMNVAEDVTDQTNGQSPFSVTGGTLNVTGSVTADVEVSNGGNVTIDGTVTGDLTIDTTATGTITTGAVSGTVDNQSSSATVTVDESPVGKVETMTDEVLLADLDDQAVEGNEDDSKLVGTYTVSGTYTTHENSDSQTVTTYTLTLTAKDLVKHQNGQGVVGAWAGIKVAAAENDYYLFGWGTYSGDTFSGGTQLTSGDLEGEQPGRCTFYRNFSDGSAQNSFYVVIKDSSNNISIYNVTCDVTVK